MKDTANIHARRNYFGMTINWIRAIIGHNIKMHDTTDCPELSFIPMQYIRRAYTGVALIYPEDRMKALLDWTFNEVESN